MARIAALVAAGILAGCGGPKADDTQRQTPQQAQPIWQPPVFDGAPSLDTMVLPDARTYCAFFPKGHEFVFDDPDTWEFVFVTLIGDADSSDLYDGMVSLNGDKRAVELITQQDSEAGEVRTYRTKDAPVAVLVLDMARGEEGMESVGYSGTIAVTLPDDGPYMEFEGDCGV